MNIQTVTHIQERFTKYARASKLPKLGWCIHHTEGDALHTSLAHLERRSKQGTYVGVAFAIDRQGNVYQLFQDWKTQWAWHLTSAELSKKLFGNHSFLDKSLIGIELANYGPVTARNEDNIDKLGGKYYTHRVEGRVEPWRGCSVFEAYTELQFQALADLIHFTARELGINPSPASTLAPDLPTFTAAQLGIYNLFTHANFRAGNWNAQRERHMIRYSKLDCHPQIERLRFDLNLSAQKNA